MIEIHLPEPALRTPARQRVAGDGFACVQDRAVFAATFQLPRHVFSAPRQGPNPALLPAEPMKQLAASARNRVLSIMDRTADVLSP